MKSWFLIVLLVLSGYLFSAELKGKVIKVSDGDTIMILTEEKRPVRIRLDKIDAPEKKQAFGYQSKKYLSSLIFRKDIIVKYKKIDRYGRVLGIIYYDGQDINLLMIKSGMAHHYRHFDKTLEYMIAEKEARENRVGLWQDANPIEPYQFRKLSKRRRN